MPPTTANLLTSMAAKHKNINASVEKKVHKSGRQDREINWLGMRLTGGCEV